MPLALERRKYSRVPLPGLKIFSKNTDKFIGESRDISPQGIAISTENPFRVGDKIFLQFKLPGQIIPIKAYSEVKWMKLPPVPDLKFSGMGVQFISMHETDIRKLEKYIEMERSKLDSDNFSLADFSDLPDKNLFKKTKLFWEFMGDIKEKGYDNYGLPLLSACKNRVIGIERDTGRKREMIMMGSCNYLGLATHPSVVRAAEEATKKYGTGSEGAALLTGTFDIHKALERKLAEMKSCEDAIVFPTGYSTNLGTISALIRKGDIAIIDRLAHASIIDGCSLSTGSFRTFNHSNVTSLRSVLDNIDNVFNGKLIVVEGVYSMDGDIAPLPEVIEVAQEYGAKVMVDEAHATGVIGSRGRGTLSYFGVEGKVDIVMGTLSKALGSVGGFVASSREVINYLRYYARSGFFTINLPPAAAAAAMAAIGVMESEKRLHDSLWKNIEYMKHNLKSMGFNIGGSESAIIPIIIGSTMALRKMSKRIIDNGLYLNAIPYPAVPRGQERFRLSIMATHTREDLDKTLEVLEKVGREFGILGRNTLEKSSLGLGL